MRSKRGWTRRRFLTVGGVGSAALVVAGATRIVGTANASHSQGPVIASFQAPLPIPPVLNPVRSDADTDYYEIAQQEAKVEILPGVQTTIWGYNGMFPGPTIETRRGRKVAIRQTNRLPSLGGVKAAYVCGDGQHATAQGLPVLSPADLASASVVHLHGGVTPSESDGFPTDLIPPGGFKDYTYPNDQRATTLFYHDHAMNTTAYHNYMGLAGLYIVHDDVEDRLPLPKGAYDVPLILQDRSFTPDGQFLLKNDQFFADENTILVNGAPWPHFEVAARKYRFRILNASNSRPYILALSSGKPLVQIATDGGLMAAPAPSASIPLSPAERIQVVIDFADYPVGSQVVLQNGNKQGQMSQVMRFDVVRKEQDDSAIPAKLADIETLRPEQAVRTRTFVFAPLLSLAHAPYIWKINGQEFDPNRVDAMPKLGDVEIWRFVNAKLFNIHGMPHPIHMHLVNFQLLDRNNGQKPAPYETGWKDTLNVPEGEEARVITRFEGYKGKYLLHCHNLQHEDCAMMTTFQTV